jgi:hypothetical protein
MANILLTGAGFSKNWGGLIAEEFFSRLLGEELDEHTRDLLFERRNKGGFESVMSELQSACKSSPTDQQRLDNFAASIRGIFNFMNNQVLRTQFEFQNEVRYMVRSFLERFDVIFSLNQDCLLEAQYFPGFVGGRWNGSELPGTKAFGPPPHIQGTREERIAHRTPDMKNYGLQPRMQPYFKLHGSSNWVVDDRSGPLLILGGEKSASIGLHPLLTRYMQEFTSYLRRPGTRLMIVGYGFGDAHINEEIGKAAEAGAKVFIVDPNGVDAFEKLGVSAYSRLMRPSIIGESKKPLTATFGSDHAENGHLMSFFK